MINNTFSAWLAGPAPIVLGLGLTEDGDSYTLAAQVKYAKVRRLHDKEGFADADGEPFDVADAGTYADRLVTQQMKHFSDLASAWLQEAIQGLPNKVRLVITVRCLRDDAHPEGLAISFLAAGDSLPDGSLLATSFDGFRTALLAAFPSAAS